MNSLEWRLKKLEQSLLGKSKIEQILLGQKRDEFLNRETILDQLDQVASFYSASINGPHKQFPRFVELYNRHKNSIGEKNSVETQQAIVLAYEKELREYMHNLETMVSTADKVLDSSAWPDMTTFQDRLDKLQKINKEQVLQSSVVDKRTEELIQIYNDTITSFKKNMIKWDEQLEAVRSKIEKDS